MFPNKISMHISSLIHKNWRDIYDATYKIQESALKNTDNEVSYFDYFVPGLRAFLNSYRIPGITFSCITGRNHGKPKVKFRGTSTGPELGDYFINVKYFNGRKLLGKKFINYQFKIKDRTKDQWKIDQRQLRLLRDWPYFEFGKKGKINRFNLNPKTPEFGSYWLIQRDHQINFRRGGWSILPRVTRGYDIVADATHISNVQVKGKIDINGVNSTLYPFTGTEAILLQLMWKIGEFIEPNSDIENFVETLYRYLGMSPDPPNEFKNYSTNPDDGKITYGLEISVIYEKK